MFLSQIENEWPLFAEHLLSVSDNFATVPRALQQLSRISSPQLPAEESFYAPFKIEDVETQTIYKVPKITQLVGGGAGIWIQNSPTQKIIFQLL